MSVERKLSGHSDVSRVEGGDPEIRSGGLDIPGVEPRRSVSAGRVGSITSTQSIPYFIPEGKCPMVSVSQPTLLSKPS